MSLLLQKSDAHCFRYFFEVWRSHPFKRLRRVELRANIPISIYFCYLVKVIESRYEKAESQCFFNFTKVQQVKKQQPCYRFTALLPSNVKKTVRVDTQLQPFLIDY